MVSLSIATPALAAEPAPTAVSGANMTAKQKLDHAQQTADRLSAGVSKILNQIEDAEERKDILRLNCLNEKLGSLRGLLKVVDDAKFGLQEAVARENLDLQEFNYRKVVISDEQGQVMLAEAEACAGAGGGTGGDGTRVVVSVNGGGEGGDDGFGTSPNGTTRTDEASPR